MKKSMTLSQLAALRKRFGRNVKIHKGRLQVEGCDVTALVDDEMPPDALMEIVVGTVRFRRRYVMDGKRVQP